MNPINPRRSITTPLALLIERFALKRTSKLLFSLLLAAGALVLSLHMAFEVGTENAGGEIAVSNAWELQNMSNDLSADYYLTNDIDAGITSDWNSGAGFEPVGNGSNEFTGTLNGHGYNITGLFVDRTATEYIGLFGHLDTGASLANLNLVQCDVSGKKYVGGLLGFNGGGSVENSSTTGKVDGSMNVGGLVGKFDSGAISNSYSIADVRGDAHVAGLVGDGGGGTIEMSFAAGSVSGDWDVGAIIGWNGGTTMEDCFFDNQTTGLSSGAGGGSSSGTTGKNTSDMQKQSTFTNGGWDFQNVWNILEGQSYPYHGLREISPAPIITSKDIVECYEDEMYRVDYEYFDGDSEESEITWALLTNATFLRLDHETGVLNGTPDQDDTGSYWVNVSISDGEYQDHRNFTLRVIEVNENPTILTGDITSCLEDIELLVDYEAFDEENDMLTWSIDSNASFLTIHPGSGELAGTPLQEDVGSYYVNVSVSDGGLIGYQNFTLVVIGVNDPPMVILQSPANATEVSGIVVLAGYALDVDGNQTLELVQVSVGGDGWQTANGTTSWTFEWNTGALENGDYTLSFRAFDGTNHSKVKELILSVNNSLPENKPPVITITSPKQGAEVSGTVTFKGSILDEDGSVEKVEIYIEQRGWLSAQMNGNTSWNFQWDTTTVDDGEYLVKVRGFDGSDYSEEVNVTMKVKNRDKSDEGSFLPGSGVIAMVGVLGVAAMLLSRKR